MGPVADPGRREPRADERLVAGLRAGDEACLEEVFAALNPGLLRMAAQYVPSAVADEVVQETWIAVLDGIDTFEGRSSLRTWIYRIMLNKARNRWRRERRTVPHAIGGPHHDPYRGAIAPERLHHPDLGAQYWPDAPSRWETLPEDRLLGTETMAVVEQALAGLPPAQREVMSLRDVEGWTGPEVSRALGISLANQRVLLHRARAAVRTTLETYLAPGTEEPR